MSKQNTYISFIVDELKKGNVEWQSVKSVFVSKWHLGERQFTRYWNKAQEQHKEYLQKLNEHKDELSIELEKKALKSNVLTKIQRLEIASNIAQGKARKIDGQLIIPSDGDRIRALDYLAKVEGDYAPTSSIITGKDGAPLLAHTKFKVTLKKKDA